jgi:hypothetical protein
VANLLAGRQAPKQNSRRSGLADVQPQPGAGSHNWRKWSSEITGYAIFTAIIPVNRLMKNKIIV